MSSSERKDLTGRVTFVTGRKMGLVTERGNRYYGTIPFNIIDASKGDLVNLQAYIKDGLKRFYFKHPIRGAILEKGTT